METTFDKHFAFPVNSFYGFIAQRGSSSHHEKIIFVAVS